MAQATEQPGTENDSAFRAFLPVFPAPRYTQPMGSEGGWQSYFDQRVSGMWLESPEHYPSLKSFVESARERADKRLDILSVIGAGHHIIPFRHRDVLAMTETAKGQRLLIRTPHIIALPNHVRAAAANDPTASNPLAPRASHHISMRYFRLAQVSADPFGCFTYVYRALESMLDEKRIGTPGKEAVWFRSAIGIALKQSQQVTRDGLGEYADPDLFFAFVYQEVRNGLFHAKGTRNPVIPLNPPDVVRVRKASRLASLLFLDLARDLVPIGRGERVEHDLDMFKSSIDPANLRGLQLFSETGDRVGPLIPMTINRDEEHLGHLLSGRPLEGDDIPQGPLRGVEIVFEGGGRMRAVFDALIDGRPLCFLEIQVFMAADFELAHRTNGWIPESGVRVAPRGRPPQHLKAPRWSLLNFLRKLFGRRNRAVEHLVPADPHPSGSGG